MASTPISIDLEPGELALLDSLVELSGSERSTLVSSLLRRGMKEMRFDEAVNAYRHDTATLSRATEIAGVPIRDFLARMEAVSLELHYGNEDFEADLVALDKI
jgi:predicted HTH domain antitoxin